MFGQIPYDDCKYWKYQELEIFEQNQEYPPRFRIKCIRKNTYSHLLCDFVVQRKRNNEMVSTIGQFPFAKITEGNFYQLAIQTVFMQVN